MFLGLDLGTSGVKAVVLAADGTVHGQASAPLAVQRPRSGWSEQDPADWWQAADLAVRALDPALRRGVRALGLAGQMHGATLLDAADRVLRPAMLWNDGRAAAQCAELEAAVPALHAITGNLAMPGFTAPKLLWVREHEPELFGRIATVLLPKDWLRLRLTGERVSDMSDAAGTLWLDVGARAWSAATLAACGLSPTHMPRLVEGSAPAGRLRAEVADGWGMGRVVVAGGGGDNAAGAAGMGVVEDGDALLSLGTSGVIFVATDRFRPNAARAMHAFCHCVPDRWHQMSVHLSAASCIDWAMRLTGAADAPALFALAEAAGVGGGPELFLPYLSGERTPHNDVAVRGALLGLDHDTDPGRLAAAVLEGVAFALADGLATITEAGTAVGELSVIGGGARSRHWGRVLAAALDVPLAYRAGGEVGPALGAARLAQLAADGGPPAAACVAPPLLHRIEPDLVLRERLAPKRAAFAAAYPRLTPKGRARP